MKATHRIEPARRSHRSAVERNARVATPTGGMALDGTNERHLSYDAIETVLKGPEIEMIGYRYEDKDGHVRKKGRAEWWNTGATTLRGIIRIDPSWKLYDEHNNPATELPATPLTDIAESVPTYPAVAPPVLFGHYWFTGAPQPLTDTTACVDFSAVKGGPLAAYRWDGEPALAAANFVTT